MPHAFYANDKQVNYHAGGSGRPVLLLHGFGFDARAWQPLLAELEKHARVIRVELPGAGESELPDGEPSLEAYAEAVAAVLRCENATCCTVIGHSMGGYVALELLARHVELVDAIALVHSHPFGDTDEQKDKRLKDAAFIEKNGSEKFIPVLIPKLFAELFASLHAATIDGLVGQYRSLPKEGLVYALKAMRHRPDRSELLKLLNKPLLLIVGLNDVAVSEDVSFKAAKLSERTHMLVLRDAGHMGMYEATALCCETIVNWLRMVHK